MPVPKEKSNLFGVLSLIDNASSEGFEERRRLQKMILIAKLDPKINYPFTFEYIRHFYGPYSFDLKALMDQLVRDKLLEEKSVNQKYVYKLTEIGKIILRNLDGEMPKEHRKKIDNLWKNYKNYPSDTLILKSKELFGW